MDADKLRMREIEGDKEMLEIELLLDLVSGCRRCFSIYVRESHFCTEAKGQR